jgi:uncharacterized protein YciI
MWFLCMRSNVRSRSERQATLADHFVWMQEQHERGHVVMSGPADNKSLGMYLIRADSRAQAEAVAAGDPYTAAGDCTFRIIDWEIHQILGIGSFQESAFRSP